MRKYIYDILEDNKYKVYSPGKVTAPTGSPYVVVRILNNEIASNSEGSYLHIELLCYVPDSSIFQLDQMINDIKSILMKSNIADDFAGMNGDYHDTALKSYMRNIKFKIPHTTK